MNLSLAFSGLFTASCLWCQGVSLAVEASTNGENSPEHQVNAPEAGSFHHPVKDVGSGTLENHTTKRYDIPGVQKTRSLSSLKYWGQVGNNVTEDGSSLYYEEFGESVALNKKGTRLVVGAPIASPCPYEEECAGKIQIFDLVESTWTLMQTIAGVARTIDGSKGEHISITPNGNHIAVHNGGNWTHGGSFSVYERDDATGVFSLLGSTTSEVNDDGFYSRAFGTGIEISRNGTRVALGNPEYLPQGKAYVYEYNTTSSQWTIVFNTTTPTSLQISHLGKEVSLAADGTSVFVVSDNRAFVFEEDNESNWIQSSLPITDEEPWTFEGAAMSGDGTRVALAYPYIGTYIFDKIGTNWVLNGNTPLMGLGLYSYDYCGRDVAISADGKKVIMACWNEFGSTMEEPGYGIVYQERESGAWSQFLTHIFGSGGVNAVAIADRGNGKGTKVALSSPASYWGPTPTAPSVAVYEVLSTSCIDSTAEMRMDTMNMDNIPFFCKWINEGQGSTCSDYGFLQSHCPKSCGNCTLYGCLDSTATFVVGGSETTCESLSASDPSLINVVCKKNKRVRTSCRDTCGYCE